MRVRGSWQGGVIAALAIVWVVVAGSRAVARDRVAPGAPQEGRPDRAEALFLKVCTECHQLDHVTGARRDRQQWEEVIGEMIAEGAKATEEEFATVTKYLLAHYGRVNANRAAAPGLIEVLGISEADAGRIVAFRTKNGKFENFDALTKVPEIDVEALRAHRDCITF